MTPRLVNVADAIAAADRVLADPDRNAMRVSTDEVLAMCAVVQVQHAMIVAAGLAYPGPPAQRLEAAE